MRTIWPASSSTVIRERPVDGRVPAGGHGPGRGLPGDGALWRAARDGRLLALASEAASHNTAAGVVRALKDIMAF